MCWVRGLAVIRDRHGEQSIERLRRSLLSEKNEAEKVSQVAKVSRGGRGQEGGVRAAARELGIDKDAAHRAIKVEGLEPEAKEEAKSLGLDDNQSVLFNAAQKTGKEAQVRAMREASAKRADKASGTYLPFNR